MYREFLYTLNIMIMNGIEVREKGGKTHQQCFTFMKFSKGYSDVTEHKNIANSNSQ